MMSTPLSKDKEYDALADWYDILWPRTEDLAFYSNLATQHGSPILELGCGTGRVACELAKQGQRVVGIDVSDQMLTQAAERRSQLDSPTASRVEFLKVSMTDFDLSELFMLIISPFSGILELSGPKERLASYLSCRHHLVDGGVFAFDSSFSGAGHLADWGAPRPPGVMMFSGTSRTTTIDNKVFHHFEALEYQADGRLDLTAFLDEVSSDGAVRRRTFPVLRHYVSPEQTKAELLEAGFRDIQIYGGFKHEPLYDSSLKGRGRQIFIARL